MSLERKKRVVAQHAAAIVGDLNELFAARFNVDPNAGRTGIQRIFEQFFDHRSRTFYYLASGDLIGNVLRQYVNSAHRASTLSA